MDTIELKIEGMSCDHCADHVRGALERVDGVEAASVDLEGGRATVRARGVATAELTAAVEAAGYGASPA